MWRYQEYNTDNEEYEIKYSKCNYSCQWNWDKVSCWLWCRNNTNLDTCTTEEFFSDKIFWNYNSKYKSTEEEFLNRIENILKNIY